MNKVKIRLIGSDRSLHAEGEVSTKILSNVSIIERNKHLYKFNHFKNNLAEFEECGQPYVLTEF